VLAGCVADHRAHARRRRRLDDSLIASTTAVCGTKRGALDADTHVSLDQPFDVGIRPDKMHFLDLETGARSELLADEPMVGRRVRKHLRLRAESHECVRSGGRAAPCRGARFATEMYFCCQSAALCRYGWQVRTVSGIEAQVQPTTVACPTCR
jgi:hypothetical protein